MINLIDGSGYIYRAYYALPPLTQADGTPIHAIYGYCDMLRSLIATRTCSHMAVILDGGRSGRTDIDPNYKANRAPRPPELVAQLAMMEEASEAFGVTTIRVKGYEADDVIATYARQSASIGEQVTIYSSDKDLLPLLALGTVSIYDPLKKQVVDAGVCRGRMGVGPQHVADLLSLVGDKSDNIPGVPLIGAVTAAQLLHAHGSLTNILQLAETNPSALIGLKQGQRASLINSVATARLSRKLVELQHVDGVPNIDAARCRHYDPDALADYLRRMEFLGMAETMGLVSEMVS